MILPAIPEFIIDLDISYEDSSWILATFLVTGAIMTPIAGKLSDIYGKRKVLLIILGVISLSFLKDRNFMSLLDNTKKVSDLSSDDFDAIIVVGGQGPMFTFKAETGLQNAFLEFYNKGKISAALCHGTSLLLYLKDKDGKPLIQGKKMTGFTDEEEDFADKAVGKKVMPFRIEDEAKKLGAEFQKANAFEPFVIKDSNLITGQQQHSGAEVAKLVIDSLDK
jgi:putative intracellular protease/amidase